MKDQQSQIKDLFHRWINGQATAEQVDELMKLLGNVESEKRLLGIMNEGWSGLDDLIKLTDEQKAIIAERSLGIIQLPEPEQSRKVHFMRRWWVAASVILIVGLGFSAYYWSSYEKNAGQDMAATSATEILPGKEGAILTLADGTRIVLDSLQNGVIATQNGTQVLLKDGRLAYDPGTQAGGDIVYNTMSTPNGRLFRVTLPDGTQVWLNSASSIRYPTVFTGNERKVTITGEAYFEVAKNANMPFLVNVNNKAEIEVLGTHFNVNAYDNEPSINTTLLEGSVKVMEIGSAIKKNHTAMLKQGQQAVLTQDVGFTIHDNADLNKVMAWKNGLFNFQDVPLEVAMRQLERWYDVEVVYENGVPDVQLVGGMTKDIPLNDLLVVLGKIRVQCRLEGRKMIVSK